MAYQLNLYNGTPKTTISDGAVDTSSTSLTLIGRNYAGYGTFLNENFIYLLENFARSSGPSNPLTGQLWWDATNNVVKVWSGASWKISTGATSSPASAPPGDLSALGGDLWFDTTNQQLKVYSGSAWVVVGPAATPSTGNTGAFPALMTDTSSGSHIVIQFTISGVVYCIFSKDTFTSALTGFTTIKAGINFRSTASPSWVLSNQDQAATNLTLVQRDSSAGITVAGISATAIQATSVTATTLTSSTFTGNVVGNVQATSVSATSISGSGINASSGYTGSILTAAQPNITTLGNLALLSVAGNLTTYAYTTLNGYASYNGAQIATVGGASTASYIDGVPIGGNTASTGKFTTLQATTSITPTANGVINLGSTSGGYWGTTYSNNVAANYATINNLNINGAGYLNGVAIATVGGGGSASFSSLNNTVIGNVTPTTGAFTALTVTTSLRPTANLTVDLGSSTAWFNQIYGKAVQAQYADLAERFHSDAEYAPGTVVEMGGPAEITQVVEELSERVFGVISTNAAYLMNSGAGTDATHPPIAMSGRVPVRAVGLISKGDRLVSAGNGLARAGKKEELTPWNVIGRSLVDKTEPSEYTIEAIVKINS